MDEPQLRDIDDQAADAIHARILELAPDADADGLRNLAATYALCRWGYEGGMTVHVAPQLDDKNNPE